MQLVLESIPFLSLSVAEEHEGAKVLVEDIDPDERIVSAELMDALIQLGGDPAVVAVLGECRTRAKKIAELNVSFLVTSQSASHAGSSTIVLRTSSQRSVELFEKTTSLRIRTSFGLAFGRRA